MEPRKWALLIGIDNYERATPLRFARADVRALAQSLEETCGFAPQCIRLLVDGVGSQIDVSHTGIIGSLEDMAGLVQPDDTFLFYFAGHGITRDQESYLLGVNADLSSTRRVQMTSVPMALLRGAIAAIPACEKALILDACRNDPSAGRADAPNRLDRHMWDGFRDIVVTAAGRPNVESTAAVLFACDVGQRSWEWSEKGHSVFNHYLVESLAAVRPGGEIEFTGVASYVQRQLEEWTRQNRERPQRPIYEAKGGARLVLGKRALAAAGPETGTAIKVELAFWSAIVSRGTPELYQEYLRRYPQGQFSVIARAWLNPPEAPQPAPTPPPIAPPPIPRFQTAPAPHPAPIAPPPIARPQPAPAPHPAPIAPPPIARPQPAPAPHPAPIAPQPTAKPQPAPAPHPAPIAPQPIAKPQPAPGAGPIPLRLHWGVLVLLGLFSYGFFNWVWGFVQSSFVKRIDPRSHARAALAFGLGPLIYGVTMLILGSNSVSTNSDTVTGIGVVGLVFAWLIFLVAVFSMRRSLERYYSTVEPIGLKLSGVMTFFFHCIYLQYHLRRIALRKVAAGRQTHFTQT